MIVKQIINEVTEAANRVKEASLHKGSNDNEYRAGTMFPIVEGAYRILRSIALNLGEILTVSVYDEDSDLYYSLPANIGKNGIEGVHREFINGFPEIKKGLAKVKEELLKAI